MKKEVKTPWYNYYDTCKKHLNYLNCSLYNLIKENAINHYNSISYNYYGNKKTYREFLKQIDDCAKAFKKLGVKENECVSICMPNTPEAIISFYALNKIGAIANMIHLLSAESEMERYINQSKSRIIITIDIAYNRINHIYKNTNLKTIIVVSVGNSMPLYMKTLYFITTI